MEMTMKVRANSWFLVALGAVALVARRPGTGLPPALRHLLLGRVVAQAVAAGTPITLEMLGCARLAS